MTSFATRSARVAACVIVCLSVTAHAFAQRPALTRDVDNPAFAPVRVLININLNPGETFKQISSITVRRASGSSSKTRRSGPLPPRRRMS